MGDVVESEVGEEGHERDDQEDDVAVFVADVAGGCESVEAEYGEDPDWCFVLEDKG